VKAVLVFLALAWPADASAGQVPAGAATGGSVEVGVARFYRAAAGQTVIDGFCRVPFALLEPLTRGGDDVVAAYRVTVAVRDSEGLELLSQSWSSRVPARLLPVPGGSAVEPFTFAARPGDYAVEVAVTDSASGRVSRQTLSVAAFAEPPPVSDLLLANGIRAAAGPADSTPRRGEVRKGPLFLEASSRPVLTPRQARLGYYAELYATATETVTVAMRVLTAQGTAVVSVAPERVALEAGGGATRGFVDLAGLPPGDYRLELVVTGSVGEGRRAAPFGMAGFETEAALAAVDPGPRDVFEAMTEAQLDTLYGPLLYLMTADEQGLYPSLSAEGKKRYLRQFWAKRDPTPGSARNEAQEDFYRRIAEANQRYREGGAAEIPGWRSDRGRIFIRYGPPDEVLSRPQAGSTNPYEVWKYTRGRALKYVFWDQTRFGNYALIWTDDRREPSRPNWQDLLGAEAVQDVERF
jgi:GWxTD domain-containing protein